MLGSHWVSGCAMSTYGYWFSTNRMAVVAKHCWIACYFLLLEPCEVYLNQIMHTMLRMSKGLHAVEGLLSCTGWLSMWRKETGETKWFLLFPPPPTHTCKKRKGMNTRCEGEELSDAELKLNLTSEPSRLLLSHTRQSTCIWPRAQTSMNKLKQSIPNGIWILFVFYCQTYFPVMESTCSAGFNWTRTCSAKSPTRLESPVPSSTTLSQHSWNRFFWISLLCWVIIRVLYNFFTPKLSCDCCRCCVKFSFCSIFFIDVHFFRWAVMSATLRFPLLTVDEFTLVIVCRGICLIGILEIDENVTCKNRLLFWEQDVLQKPSACTALTYTLLRWKALSWNGTLMQFRHVEKK